MEMNKSLHRRLFSNKKSAQILTRRIKPKLNENFLTYSCSCFI